MFQIHKYNSAYKDIFQKESEKIANILEPNYLIEHIGSTSVPGLDGKGIIDMMLVFNNIEEVNSAVLKLKNKYFLSKDDINRKDRFFLTSSGDKESSEGDIHLHLTTKNNIDYLNAILFRDYLLQHPEVKQKYIDLKYELFKKVKGDRADYTRQKSSFINNIIEIAKK